MIVKSMSRKVPSFGQLLDYINRDEGQEAYSILHNLAGRKPETIRAEFERNGALLPSRKNGVYLYHEIISITRAKGLSAEEQKTRLQEIAQNYIDARCPDNLAYAGLHQDKDHSYHMHLMISANRVGEKTRYRMTKHQFRQVQVQLEEHVLQTYPELEQKLAIGKRSDRGRTKGEAELERRTKFRPKREIILERVQAAYGQSDDRQSLLAALGMEGLELYVRGKTLGVVDLESGKKHRLKTLDLEMADRIAIRMEGGEVERLEPEAKEPEPAPEPEEDVVKEKPAGQKEKEVEPKRKRRRKETKEHKPKKRRSKTRETEPESTRLKKADNEDYVKYGSNADLDREPVSKQKRKSSKEKNIENQTHNPTRENDMRGKEPPAYGTDENIDRRVEIDRGERTPDPEMDIMSHEDWRKQDTFRQKFGASWRRTFDELGGIFRSKLELGDKPENAPPGRAKNKERPAQENTGRESSEKTAPERPNRSDQQSEQQKAWRRERTQERGKERNKGRDDPDRGRE